MITIATLKAAGLSAEQIVAVLETDENTRIAARRVQNRVNQQNYRKRVSADDADRADGADGDSALSYLLPSESQEKPKEVKKERAKRDRGHVCPDDFEPSEVHFEAGSKQNVSRPRVVACCEAMKSWSKSNSHRAVARKVDWNAALFGWMSREAERMGKSNGHGSSIKGAFAELRLELDRQGDGGQGSPPMRDITPSRP